jgi:hypothetical protein
LTQHVTAGGRGSALESEHDAIANIKRLGLAALATAAHAFGAGVRDEQEVLAYAANIIIESYAVESAVGRAEKMARAGRDTAPIAADIARVYTCDAMDRVAHAGKQIVNALQDRSERIDQLSAALTRIREHAGIDSVGARRRIGDAVIAAGRYVF